MNRFKDALAPMYLGFAISYFGNIKWNQWEFYAIIIPFYIIAKASGFNKNEE